MTQERMKRQMEALQERVSGAPSDIGDIRSGWVLIIIIIFIIIIIVVIREAFL